MANKGHQNVTPLNCRDPERARQIAQAARRGEKIPL